MRPEAAPAYTQDTLLDGGVRLVQRARGHRAGTDAVLLAAALRPEPGARIADFGAGSGAVGLMAAQRAAGACLYLVERDRELADLCRLNALCQRARAEDAHHLRRSSAWPGARPCQHGLHLHQPAILRTR